jgi:hypothetical protein
MVDLIVGLIGWCSSVKVPPSSMKIARSLSSMKIACWHSAMISCTTSSYSLSKICNCKSGSAFSGLETHQRDTLVALNPHFVGLGQVTFYPHDEAHLNLRKCTFSRKCWILHLGYPLDLKDTAIITQVCALFPRVHHSNSDDPSLSRVLLKVLVEDPLEMPHS